MLAVFAAVILAAAPAPKRERASADDCAVILAVGRAQMAWTARTPPLYAFFPEIEGVGGATYVEDCPWKAMGVAAPRLGDGQSGTGFWISRPAYDPSRTHATAEVTRSIVGMENQGEPMRGFMDTRACDLEKRGGSWRVVRCRLLTIS